MDEFTPTDDRGTFDRILDSIEAGIRGARTATSTQSGATITAVPPRIQTAGFGNGDLMLLGLIVVAVLLLR